MTEFIDENSYLTNLSNFPILLIHLCPRTISISSPRTKLRKCPDHPELNCENAQITIDIDRCLGLELDAAEEIPSSESE